jgi:citrate lyase subunit beta/citryl-CoA lyase
MSRRRACLVVPAAPAAKLAKGATLAADEVVLDLEDAVVPAVKDEARAAVVEALRGDWAAESVAVRVNAIGSAWCHADLEALAGSERDAVTAVLPKVEHAHDLAFADRLLAGAEAAAGRTAPVRLIALIETAAGLAAAAEIARASERLDGLVLGYADLAASLGRPGTGASQDWRFAQETVLVAARAAGIQAIDGPYLGTRDDDAFRAGAMHARTLGYDGKWAIHPAQLDTLRETFTPTGEEVADARAVLAALERAAADGAGAVAADGRMLDEALALSARRVLARAGAER